MNTISGNVEQWSKVVDEFVKGHANGLQSDEREDLRQDIFVALIEICGPALAVSNALWVDLIARDVLEKFREDRRSRLAPLTWSQVDIENQVARTTNLDLNLDIRQALAQLPTGLQNVAVDLFYREFTQQEIAVKYNRTQPWVAAAKRQIVQQVYSFLKENQLCQ